MPVPGVFSGSSSSGRASGPDGGFSRCGLGSWRFLSVMIVKQNRTGLVQVLMERARTMA